MMKKRIVSLGLAAMMTAGLFAGCGNSSESQGDSTAMVSIIMALPVRPLTLTVRNWE